MDQWGDTNAGDAVDCGFVAAGPGGSGAGAVGGYVVQLAHARGIRVIGYGRPGDAEATLGDFTVVVE